MALTLNLEFLEQNDNLALKITDNAETYHAVDNSTGWGVPNPVVTDIVDSTDDVTVNKYHLLLDVTYTGSDAVSVTYTQLNLYDVNGAAFIDTADLTWTIDAADLVDLSDGQSQGTDENALFDGKYDFVYQLVSNINHSSVITTHSVSILLDGNVRVKIYNQLRQISTIYNSTELYVPIYHHQFKDILNVSLKKALFDSMLSGVSHSATNDILNLLDTIERLTLND